MKLELDEKKNKVKEVKFSLDEKEVSPEFEHALEHFKSSIQVKGFRKGKAPLHLVKEKVDKQKLDQEVLQHIYPKLVQEIIKKHKVVPVMQPKISIDKLTEKEFTGTITFVERPDVKLPDYKKLAKQASKDVKNKENKKETKIETAKNINEAKEKAAKGVKDSSNKVEQAKNKPEVSEDQKILGKTYELIIDKANIDLADLMVEEEANRMMGQFLTQLARLKINLEDYLKHTNNKIEKIRDDYKKQAEKNLKLEFILSEISKKEDLKVTEEEITEVIKNTPEEQQKQILSQPEQKYYIESTLLKNKVANFLVKEAKS